MLLVTVSNVDKFPLDFFCHLSIALEGYGDFERIIEERFGIFDADICDFDKFGHLFLSVNISYEQLYLEFAICRGRAVE